MRSLQCLHFITVMQVPFSFDPGSRLWLVDHTRVFDPGEAKDNKDLCPPALRCHPQPLNVIEKSYLSVR